MYLFLIGLNFIAFSYLLVYIGAVSILFLFILMLINIRTSELTYNTTNSISLALYLGLIIYFILFIVLLEDVEFYIENIDYVTSTN
jgi:NADH-ubiquinone oxidoreductase chain 6